MTGGQDSPGGTEGHPAESGDPKDITPLEGTLEILDIVKQHLPDELLINGEVDVMEGFLREIYERPENIEKVGFSERAIRKGGLRSHKVSTFAFQRKSFDDNLLTVSFENLRNNNDANTFVQDIQMKHEQYENRHRLNMNQEMTRQRDSQGIGFFDTAQKYKQMAAKQLFKSLESVAFSLEDTNGSKKYEILMKTTIGGPCVSVKDYTNISKKARFATETPIILESVNSKDFMNIRADLMNKFSSFEN